MIRVALFMREIEMIGMYNHLLTKENIAKLFKCFDNRLKFTFHGSVPRAERG